MKKLFIYTLIFCCLSSCEKSESDTNLASVNSVGRGGSTARFTIAGDYMYTVDRQDLHIFNVENPKTAKEISLYNIGREIETIFSMDNYIFIGSQSAVYIYDISAPLNPKSLGIFRHATACDPVVADSNYAYVTLRNNNIRCGGTANELRLINIMDINDSYLEYEYMMESPYGLGLDQDYLFVCDNGVKMFDKTDPANLVLITKIPQIDARDLIAHKNNLIVTATDGIYQFDYSTGTLVQKNFIPVQ
jgi:hypothetical protein